MSKRFVVETLICANCAHFVDRSCLGQGLTFCDIHDEMVYPHDPFCLDADASPLLLVGRQPRRIREILASYPVV